MKKFILTALSLSAILLAFFVKPASAEVLADDAPGLLYEITGKDLKKPSYIFGTIHVICPTDMFPMDKIGGYLDQTEQLVMELDMDDAAEMQMMTTGMIIPGGKTLKELLTPEVFAKVDTMFTEKLGMPAETLKQVKPFVLQVMVSTSPKAMGCNPPGSYESSLLQAAMAKQKTVLGLETVSSQFAIFDKYPLEKQAKDLYKMSLDPQKAVDEFKKLVEAYKAQNSDNLYNLIATEMATEMPDLQPLLLDERNKNWVPKIEKLISEKPSFIAVGGGHLGGKNGVLNLLRAKGYQIRSIKL